MPRKHLHSPNCTRAVPRGSRPSDSLATHTPQVQVQEHNADRPLPGWPAPPGPGLWGATGGKNTSLPKVSARCGGARASPQDNSLPSATRTLHQPPVFTQHQGPAYSPGFLNDGGGPQTPPLIPSLPHDGTLPAAQGPVRAAGCAQALLPADPDGEILHRECWLLSPCGGQC